MAKTPSEFQLNMIEPCISCGKRIEGWVGRAFAMTRRKYFRKVGVINVGEQDRSGSALVPLGEVYAKLCAKCCDNLIQTKFQDRDAQITENKKMRRVAFQWFLGVMVSSTGFLVVNVAAPFMSWLLAGVLVGIPMVLTTFFLWIHSNPQAHLARDVWTKKLDRLKQTDRTQGEDVQEEASMFLALFLRDRCNSNSFFSDIQWDTENLQIKDSSFECGIIQAKSIMELKDELRVPSIKPYSGSRTL